jgi:hypothetical protein
MRKMLVVVMVSGLRLMGCSKKSGKPKIGVTIYKVDDTFMS